METGQKKRRMSSEGREMGENDKKLKFKPKPKPNIILHPLLLSHSLLYSSPHLKREMNDDAK
jgi:hypothetical protein